MSEALSNLSGDMASAVASVGPSVVPVAARDRLPGSGIVWSTDGIIITGPEEVMAVPVYVANSFLRQRLESPLRRP